MLKAKTIKERYHILTLVSGIGFLILFVGAEGAAFLGAPSERTRWQFLAVPAFVMMIFLLVYYRIRIRGQEKKLDEEVLGFVNSRDRDLSYQPTVLWSQEEKAVLDRYEQVLKRKEMIGQAIEASRYLALQQQINPHFLYNALDSIRGDILIAGEEQIAETVEALSKYFSYAISNLDRLATIQEELGNVKDYFRVQQYRFEDRIHLEIENDLEEDGRNLMLPRMTLQPLVENAILHGLEKLTHEGTVTLTLEETPDQLIVRVADDGIGMPEAELAQLNDRLKDPLPESLDSRSRKKKGGIALNNLNRRIRLLFGDGYGMKIYSMEQMGTEVCLFLPRITREEVHE